MISVFGSLVGPEELEEIRTSIENQWMGLGPKVKQFEEDFATRLGLPSLVMVDSGSNALYLALKAMNLPRGSEVILPAFTWIACAQAVALNGLKPVFCDVDLETQNVTAETISAQMSDKTSAVMIVHYAGKPVEMAKIMALGVPVLEDAAHAVDSKIGERYCGGIGAVGCYSFDAVKNLATPEGGGVTSSDPAILERARRLRYCGIAKSGFEAATNKARWWEYQIDDFCPKLLPNDIVASIGLAQLRKLDTCQATRRRIWEQYQGEFENVSWLARPVDAAPGEQHSYFTYNIRVVNGKRDELARHLLDKGIYTTLRYHPLHYYPIYESNLKLPMSEQLNEEALCIPLHPRLSSADVETIVAAIRGFNG
ncbi:DegT/DnrJ/EryC1/StrS family aminotransferase [bacterium]|nr:DegT/DnrJ/EryC1/StrS family aminotransferase [bacterium]